MPHSHESKHKPVLLEEMLSAEYLDGGEIRHRYFGLDGFEESVAINNLLAAQTRYARDLIGNSFGCYLVVPSWFWKILMKELMERQGRGEDGIRREPWGSFRTASDVSMYVDDTYPEHVLMRVDTNGVFWKFKLGDDHRLLHRTAIRELVGPNKGYDLEIPYHPQLGYAPKYILKEWAEQGLIAARAALEQVEALEASTGKLLPPQGGWPK